MNGFFGNMHPYEIIMSVMGVIIFLALVFLLVWMVMKKRSIVVLIPFFLISVVMVAFPTLSSVKVGDFIIDVRDQTKLVSENPTDSIAVKNLIESLNQLANNKKLLTNSDALVAAANAEIVLGEYESASEYLKKGEEINPEAKGLMQTKELLKEKIEISNNFKANVDLLNSAINQLNETPKDNESKRKIAETLSEIKAPDYVNSKDLKTIAESYAVIGHEETSLQVIDKIEPTLSEQKDNEIIKLRDSLEKRVLDVRKVQDDTSKIKVKDQESVILQRINPFEKSVVRRKI